MKTVINIEDYKKNHKKLNRENHDKDKDLIYLSKYLEENLEYIKSILGASSDLTIRTFNMLDINKTKIAILYFDVLVDETTIQSNILKPLMSNFRMNDLHDERINRITPENLYHFIIPETEIKEISDYENLLMSILSGEAIILIDGYNHALSVDEKGFKARGVEEPSSQTVIRGPKDGFTECIRTNIGLIRRKLKDKNLWIETMQIGRRTKTEVSILYIHDVADKEVVDECRRRLKKIDIDGIIESGNIEEFIRDHRYSLFPTVANTERPDNVVANLLEGRVSIVVDGTPFVLILPVVFYQFFQSTEDYYNQFHISSFIRLLRYLALFIALLAPAIYIALVNFHHEMIPTLLLINIAAKREGIPFPAFFEALLMEITFEILREAGVRMPRAVGGTISIVGALVIGQAAVEAGIVSPIMIIIVAITAISSFVFPNYNMMNSIRLTRFLFMLLAVVLGLYGIVLGIFALIMYLCSLRSFGIPYMSPVAPFNLKSQKDTFVRFPIFSIFFRSQILNQQDQTKLKKE